LYVQSLDRGDASVAVNWLKTKNTLIQIILDFFYFFKKDFIKGAALKWNALAQQDKDVFIQEAKANREEFKLKLKEWETKMIAEGHAKLVRKSLSGTLQKNLKI
jgi:hypothetical protein